MTGIAASPARFSVRSGKFSARELLSCSFAHGNPERVLQEPSFVLRTVMGSMANGMPTWLKSWL
jgi:hypothetical protein